ncbi:protein kinase [Thermoproteota archaeon]
MKAIPQAIKSRYKLIKIVSEDLVSFLYSGMDMEKNCPVLIWVYKFEYLTASIVEEFITVSEVLIQIRHPHILTLLDYHYDGDYFYAVHEHRDELTPLEVYLKQEEKSSLRLLWRFSTQVLLALLELETKKLYHGSLNLRNVFVTKELTIKITQTYYANAIIGAFMHEFDILEDCIFLAPEFIQRRAFTIQSDIYSYGVLLYLFFDGHWPYEYTTNVEAYKRQLLEKPKKFEKINSRVPGKLEQVIMMCMRKEPRNRFKGFEELLSFYRMQEPLEPSTLEEGVAHFDIMDEIRSSLAQEEKEQTITRIRVSSVIGAIVFVVLTGLFLYNSYFSSIPNQKVPDIIGMDAEEAALILKNAHLAGKIAAKRPHQSVPKGHVIEAQPAPGRMVKENRIIRLFVSLGQPLLQVPDLIGHSVLGARNLLQSYGERLIVAGEEYSISYREGDIMAQFPSPNTEITTSQDIEVTVSKGLPITVTVGKVRSFFFFDKSNMRRVRISFFLLPQWGVQNILIYYSFNHNVEKIYSDHHEPGDTVELEFELDLGGQLDVYFNDNLGYKVVIEDPLESEKEESDEEVKPTPSVFSL